MTVAKIHFFQRGLAQQAAVRPTTGGRPDGEHVQLRRIHQLYSQRNEQIRRSVVYEKNAVKSGRNMMSFTRRQ